MDFDAVARAAPEVKPRLFVEAVVPAMEACGCATDLDLVRWSAREMSATSQWLTVVPVDPAQPPDEVLALWR